MRYNINKKKKLNFKNPAILSYMFLNLLMNNIYKYIILVIIILVWFIWYVKYNSKTKEGWWWNNNNKSREQLEREERERRRREEERRRREKERARKLLEYKLDVEASLYNRDIATACLNKAFRMHKDYSNAIKELYKCYYSYDIVRKGTTLKSK